ncbi:MAG: hypothetical protein N3G21_13660 [Candidatus Hydrogenedentes bacterium]|nr:hypothetical protein [Candidatus Hydrogenedentota bacterium]
MSETIRVYTRDLHSGRKKSNGFFGKLFWFVVVAFIFVSSWVLWISKDSHRPEEFLPPSPNFQIFSPNLMQNCDVLLKSSIWQFVDGNVELEQVRRFLSGEQGIPLWVTKHLICDFFYLSADELTDPKTYLVIIKLSRLGCVIEYLYTLLGNVEYDWAGGIDLYYSSSLGVCHTRKGRLVILSSSRDNIIKVVTKSKKEKTALPERVSKRDNFMGIEAWGSMKPRYEMNGVELSGLKFSIDISESEIFTDGILDLKYKIEEPWTLLFGELNPGKLRNSQIETPFFLGCYTNVPLRTWINAIEASKADLELLEPKKGEVIEITEVIKEIIRVFNDEFYISIDSFYFDEIVPFIPKVAFGGSIIREQWNLVSQRVFNLPVLFQGEPQRFMSTNKVDEYRLPLIGSSEADWIFSCEGDTLVVGNSVEVREWLSTLLNNTSNWETGNIILKIKPGLIIENVSKGLEPLVLSKLVRIRDEQKFNEVINKFKLVDAIVLKVLFEPNRCKFSSRVKLGKV